MVLGAFNSRINSLPSPLAQEKPCKAEKSEVGEGKKISIQINF